MNPRTLLSCGVLLYAAIWPSPRSSFAQGSAILLTAIHNPTVAAYANFGGAVAGLGSDRVVVGAIGDGLAYLFSANGLRLATFNNPELPKAGGFGGAVTPVGIDRVLVGASDMYSAAGRAYLFTTNGAWLATFTNPSPATIQALGWAMAAVGGDRVLISGVADINHPGPYPGGVYLFQTNGALITNFANPHPATDAGFGIAVAALGTDSVLIGAAYDNTGATASGVAYRFSTNGVLLTTFTNPVPAARDNFGSSVVAVGADRVLIGAIDYGNAKGTGGAAYLFTTNGTLVATFANPAPASYAYFGWSVAAVGSTRVLIGAYQDGTGAFQAGSAYLFSTNGSLLTTITNPAPAATDWFGASVAAAGSDRVLVGAVWDSSGATQAGSAYVYDLPYPGLNITRTSSAVSLTWITRETGLTLQQTDNLGTPPAWSNTTSQTSINGLTNEVQQLFASPSTNRFFRLRRP
jgi:hypothetical protein